MEHFPVLHPNCGTVCPLLWESISQRNFLRKTWRSTCSQRIRFAQTVHQWPFFFLLLLRGCLFFFFCERSVHAVAPWIYPLSTNCYHHHHHQKFHCLSYGHRLIFGSDSLHIRCFLCVLCVTYCKVTQAGVSATAAGVWYFHGPRCDTLKPLDDRPSLMRDHSSLWITSEIFPIFSSKTEWGLWPRATPLWF